MQVKEIASTANPLIKTVRSLHDRSGRKKSGLFLLEGTKLLHEALSNDVDLQDIIVSRTFWKNGMPGMPETDRDELILVEDNIFSQLATTETPQGVLAVASIKTGSLKEVLSIEKPLIVVSDAVQDPGNLGTIMRASLAFGATGMILTKGTTDPFSPKVVRSAMGALFSIPVVVDVLFDELIEQLRAHDVTLFALDQNAKENLWESQFPDKIALILGNEGNGISDDNMEKADKMLAIPISRKSESLNVAIAAGVALSYISSKRGVDRA